MPINDGTLVFAQNSFIKYVEPSSPAFTKAIDTNADSWQDEVFTSSNPIKPAEALRATVQATVKPLSLCLNQRSTTMIADRTDKIDTPCLQH